MQVNIVIPIAGQGNRFVKAGYKDPKPFINVHEKPMIVRVLENLHYANARYIIVARKEHIDIKKDIVKYIEKKFNATFVSIDYLTEGAACTVLHARSLINNDIPMVIANSDQIVDVDFSDYVNDCIGRSLDGSIMTFKDPENNSKWSFAKTNSDGLVQEVCEKEPISDMATVGIYMFKRGKDYVDSAIDMIVQNDRVNNEFYVCPVYNYAIRNRKIIGTYDTPFEAMHGVGTPEDLDTYLDFIIK